MYKVLEAQIIDIHINIFDIFWKLGILHIYISLISINTIQETKLKFILFFIF